MSLRCRLCGELVRGEPCIRAIGGVLRKSKPRLAIPVPPWPALEPVELPLDAFAAHNLDLVERGRVALPTATFVPVGER